MFASLIIQHQEQVVAPCLYTYQQVETFPSATSNGNSMKLK